MSTKRRLVSRSRLNEPDSPAQRSRQQDSETGAAARQPALLPPYEPPSCGLLASGKRQLDALRVDHDTTKYKKHIQVSIKVLSNCAAQSNDRLHERQRDVEINDQRRQKEGRGDEGKARAELGAEEYLDNIQRKVDDFTANAEKALRDLIDYEDELAEQDSILAEVHSNIPTAQPYQPRSEKRARPNDDEDGENVGDEEAEEVDEAPAADEDILSAVELLKKSKEDYLSNYKSNSMRARYGDNNDYVGFKRVVHDALNPGTEAPPVPHASTWFPEEASGNRRGNRVSNNEDDEVVIARATTNLKCPLTLQYFEMPFSNNKCRHTYEKQAILDYINDNGTMFGASQAPRGRGRPQGPKQAKCPQVGCDAMLEEQDFHDDQLLLRQVKRAKKEAARGDEDEVEEEDYERPQRSQHSTGNATDLENEDESMEVDGARDASSEPETQEIESLYPMQTQKQEEEG